MATKSYVSVLASFYLALSLTVFPSLLLAANTLPPSSQNTSSRTADEVQMMKDRETAIAEALKSAETAKKKSGGKKSSGSWLSKLKFWGRNSTSETSAKSSKPASLQSSKEKPVDNKKKDKKSAKKNNNWQEVMKKREERLDRFPTLDPEQVQESINQLKVELKKGFLDAGEHNLDDVIGRSVQVNLPAQIAYERVQLSERRILKSVRDLFSSVDFSRTQKDGSFTTGPYKSRSWRLALKQPLFHGGVLWNTMRLEMANREAAKKDLDKATADLIQQASAAYFEYERALRVLEDRNMLYQDIAAQKKIADEKAKANLVSEIEKLNLDSLAAQANYNLETAKQELELSKLELQRVLELDLSDAISVKPLYDLNSFDIEKIGILQSENAEGSAPQTVPADSKNAMLAADGKDLDRYIDLAYLNQPDLQVEAYKLRSARIASKVSGGKFLPQADLIVEFGQLGERFTEFNGIPLGDKPEWKDEWKIGTELSWNIGGNSAKYAFDHDQKAPSISVFEGEQGPISTTHTFNVSLLDSLGSITSLKETKIAVLEQLVELDKTERDVIRKVKEAYFNYNKALIQLESQYKRMQYRQKSADLAKHRLDNNEIQISEYVQSQIDYDEARSQAHKALADFYLSKTNLNRAIGIRNYLKIEPLRFESR